VSVAATDPVRPAARGRADLHVHSRASDGVSGVDEILDAAVAAGLDVVAITDHERVDGALAAVEIARERALPLEVIVGEEITTRGGHLLGLWLQRRVRPLRGLGWSIAAVHEQGGIAIPAHPLVPYPLCAQGWTIRRLIEGPDRTQRPDALETFNPTFFGRVARGRAEAFAGRYELARVGNSDAHAAEQVGRGWTEFPGRTAADLRGAILAGTTSAHGTFHPAGSQVWTFARQLRKYGGDARAGAARLTGRGPGRDLGYPRAMSERRSESPPDSRDRDPDPET
jgi:predicted metal-dependent phosphoesterase TrpH